MHMARSRSRCSLIYVRDRDAYVYMRTYARVRIRVRVRSGGHEPRLGLYIDIYIASHDRDDMYMYISDKD